MRLILADVKSQMLNKNMAYFLIIINIIIGNMVKELV